MSIYLGMFLISELFCILYNYKKSGKNRNLKFRFSNLVNIKLKLLNGKDLLLILSSIPFFIVASIRYYVGTDYGTYLRLQIPEVMRGITWRVEILYRYLIRFGMSLGHYQWVFALTHLVIIYFVWRAIKEQSPSIGWSIFVFMFGTFYNNSLNLMRQFIGMAICLYAIKYITQKDIKRYIFWVVIASLFHKSLVVYIPIYFLCQIKIKKEWALVIPAFCALSASLIRKVIILLANTLRLYNNYFYDIRYDVNNTQFDFIVFEYLILIICIFCDFYIIHSNSQKTDNDVFKRNVYIWLQTISTIIACLSKVIPNSTRIIILMSIGQIVYVPYYIMCSKNSKTRKAIGFLFFCLYIAVFFRVIIMRGVGNTIPYHSLFFR